MNCAVHAEVPAVAFCRTCGRAVCDDCRRSWQGVSYCTACFEDVVKPEEPAASTPAAGTEEAGNGKETGGGRQAPPEASTSDRKLRRSETKRGQSVPNAPVPALAAVLGFIPGVGAIYNGQYAKGLVHALIWGGLLSAAIASEESGQPGSVAVFVVLIVAMTLYMPIEAVRTANAIRRGEAVDELPKPLGVNGGRVSSPIGGIFLIFVGIVFLLHSLGYWQLGQVVRFWPVVLIALGIHLLYRRTKEQSQLAEPAAAGASGDEHLPPLQTGEAAPSAEEEHVPPRQAGGNATSGEEESSESRPTSL